MMFHYQIILLAVFIDELSCQYIYIPATKVVKSNVMCLSKEGTHVRGACMDAVLNALHFTTSD